MESKVKKGKTNLEESGLIKESSLVLREIVWVSRMWKKNRLDMFCSCYILDLLPIRLELNGVDTYC
jgi:hypothetical protein